MESPAQVQAPTPVSFFLAWCRASPRKAPPFIETTDLNMRRLPAGYQKLPEHMFARATQRINAVRTLFARQLSVRCKVVSGREHRAVSPSNTGCGWGFVPDETDVLQRLTIPHDIRPSFADKTASKELFIFSKKTENVLPTVVRQCWTAHVVPARLQTLSRGHKLDMNALFRSYFASIVLGLICLLWKKQCTDGKWPRGLPHQQLRWQCGSPSSLRSAQKHLHATHTRTYTAGLLQRRGLSAAHAGYTDRLAGGCGLNSAC